MKKIVEIALTVILVSAFSVSAGEVHLGAGFGTSSVNAVSAVDGTDLFVAGHFSGYTLFGGSGLSGYRGAQSRGLSRDVFIARVTASGELVWLQTVSGSGAMDTASAVAVDGSGGCYVTGSFSGQAEFGDTSGVQQVLSGPVNQDGEIIPGVDDVFLAKYGSDGRFKWAVQLGASADAFGLGLAVDAAGNAYVAGSFSEAILNGGLQKTYQESLFDVFVISYSSDGTFRWVKTLEVQGDARANAVAVNETSVFVTGSFAGSCNLDPGESTGDRYHLFVAEYNSGVGDFISAEVVGSITEAVGEALWVDAAGGRWVAGRFKGTLAFSGLSESPLVSAGSSDIFVARYAPDGGLVYAKKAGGTGADGAYGVFGDDTGRVYVTGGFSEEAAFGAGESEIHLTSRGDSDAFVAVFDSEGALVSVVQAGGSGYDAGTGLIETTQGVVFTAVHLNTPKYLYFTGSTGWAASLHALATPAPVIGIAGDLSADGTIGLEDAMGILQIISGLRP